MKKVLTPKIEAFIIENSQTLSTKKIALECGISKDVVARFLNRNNIRNLLIVSLIYCLINFLKDV